VIRRLNTRFDVYVGHFAVAQLIVDMQLGRGVAVHEVLLAMHLAQVAHWPDRSTAALQSLAKGCAKLTVEIRVDYRVQGAVEVTDPKHHRHDHVAALARIAQRRDDVPASNGKQNEHP